MHNVNSLYMKNRGGVVGRIRKMQEKERTNKRRIGDQQPMISRVNRWMADIHLSMGFPDNPSWPLTSGSGARGKKDVKRDWTRISKRGRETEGSWRLYKRDPVYR